MMPTKEEHHIYATYSVLIKVNCLMALPGSACKSGRRGEVFKNATVARKASL